MTAETTALQRVKDALEASVVSLVTYLNSQPNLQQGNAADVIRELISYTPASQFLVEGADISQILKDTTLQPILTSINEELRSIADLAKTQVGDPVSAVLKKYMTTLQALNQVVNGQISAFVLATKTSQDGDDRYAGLATYVSVKGNFSDKDVVKFKQYDFGTSTERMVEERLTSSEAVLKESTLEEETYAPVESYTRRSTPRPPRTPRPMVTPLPQAQAQAALSDTQQQTELALARPDVIDEDNDEASVGSP